MAGSASTITYDNGDCGADVGGRGDVRRITIAWTSDDTTGAVTATTQKISGRVIKVVTVPSATAQPDDDYDIAITDDLSVDILSNLGGTGGTAPSLANRDETNTECVLCDHEDSNTDRVPNSGPLVCSALSVAVTNAGNSLQGTTYIYWTPRV